MIKRFMIVVLTVVLLAAIAVPALAADVRYANAKTVKVYSEQDTSSKVLKKLKGGASVLIEQDSGSWVAILVQGKTDGQRLGWIRSSQLSSTMPQKYCKHSWEPWQLLYRPTCTEKGKRSRVCSKCGKKVTESLKALGHDWGKWRVTKEATCAKKGLRTHTCKTCGKKEKEEYFAEHTYGKWTTTLEPTCTREGEREHTCKVCGEKATQALKKLPHEYEWNVIVETTDHSAGTRAKVCKVCGHETNEESFDPEGTLRIKDRGEDVFHMQQLLVEQSYLNKGGADGVFGSGTEKALIKYQKDRGLNPDGIAWPQTLKDLEHDFGDWKTVKEMTRAEDGERIRVCRGCGFTQHEVISAGAVFEKGDRGEDVRALQQFLKEIGYDAGSLDGIYGRKLDNALAAFAKDNNMTTVNGKFRPADVDAIVSAWLKQIPDEKWKGEGGLALNVTPLDGADDSDIVTYNWSATNLGDEDVTFAAVLLSFGDVPDFRAGSLVMQLDGKNMTKNSGNSVSGSFSVDEDWGEGRLNFTAIAMNDKTGEIWMSNIVDFDNDAAQEFKIVAPKVQTIDVNDLPDGTYAIAFNPGDVFNGASGTFINATHIFTMDVYDGAEVNALTTGDTLMVENEAYSVVTVGNEDGAITINPDDEDQAPIALIPLDEECYEYRLFLEDDAATYTEAGMTTLVLDDTAVYNDSADLDKEPIIANGDDIANAITTSEDTYFNEYNTTVRVENGKVVEINRIYVP